MRIGIVSQSYLPIHGGVAEHVHHQAVELRRRGHDVKVITAYFDRGDENFNGDVIRIGHDVTIPMNGAFVNVTVGRRLSDKLREIEAEHRFDLVHIHCPLDPFLPPLAIRNIQAPKVGTFHTYMEQSNVYRVLKGKMRWYVDRLAARIAVSRAAEQFIGKYLPGKYHIIPNGVDTSRFNPSLAPIAEYDGERDILLFVGRMDPRKGLKHLLRAFPKVAAACPNVDLVIVGGGVLSRYYKGLVPRECRNRVHFEGFISGAKLPHYYATADVYCSPATGRESFGIVLIEAMASGAPVVAFANPGYKMLLEDNPDASMLVPNENDGALAETLIKLLKDKEKRQAMAAAGPKAAARYSWPRVVDQIEAVYAQVLGK